MSSAFKATKVSEHVYWVGAVDWRLREFHGYATQRGSTYNAYLILGDKVTLVETVKRPFLEEMLARIASVVDPSRIDFIVSNHAEMDHSGALPEMIERVKPEKVYTSEKGVEALNAHFHFPENTLTAVRNGEELDLGGLHFTFLETRMLHWPESMVALLKEDNLLLSQDAFGMHLASSERFADEIPPCILEHEAAKYFANILLPFAPIVSALMRKSGDLLRSAAIIAPDHGPIWRRNPGQIIDLYAKWAEQKPSRKAVVAYDTMWGSTEYMARAVTEGLVDSGVAVRLMCLADDHRSDVATEILEAGALVLGSPTMNNTLYPTLADILTYLKGLRRKNLVGGAFGSYGWSGEGPDQLAEHMKSIKVDVVADPVKSFYVPDGDCLRKCRELGEAVARRLHEVCA